MRIFAVFAVLFSLGSASAHATVLVYDSGLYTNANVDPVLSGGVPPEDERYTTDMRLTGTLTLAAPLVANLDFFTVAFSDFSFFDGINTFTPDVTIDSRFQIATNADAEITGFTLYTSFPGGEFEKMSSINARMIDGSTYVSVTDMLCGPGSVPRACSFAALPSYSQFAGNNGSSQVLRVDNLTDGPVGIPAPGGLLIVLLGMAAIVRQRGRITRSSA